jgi:hypothetical protein
MAKLVALKLTGQPAYYLVDLDKKTVEEMQGIVPDAFGYTSEAQTSGAAFTSGLDVAVAVETREDAFAGKYDTGP